MSFIEKLKSLYKDNSWRQEKRERDEKEAHNKLVRRYVKYFVKQAEVAAKEGYDRVGISRYDLNYILEDSALYQIKSILLKDYGLELSWGHWKITVSGWAHD